MDPEQEHSAARQNSLEHRVCFGPYQADFHTQEFWKHGIRIKLSGQPLQVLEMLLARPGELVTRAELQKRLWSDGTFADFNHSLNAAVNKLRESLGDSADNPKYIETLPRRGYRFIGQIDTPSSGVPKISEPASMLLATHSTEPPKLAFDPLKISQRRAWIRRASLCLGAAVIVVIVSGTLQVMKHPQTISQSRTQQEDSTKQIAVVEHPQLNESKKLQHGEIGDARAKVSPGHAPAVVGRRPAAHMVETVITSDAGNAAPQFSPDGNRMAFMSNRSGTWQIWVSNADGSNPAQLSFGESAGTPRWSPDGRQIAFDAPSPDGTSIFVISADGIEPARQLVAGLVPSFSRDGKWIYFASDRSGNWQVWKVQALGGTEKQVTQSGGFAALESTDGYVYFSKSRDANPEICRMHIEGGMEECLFPHLRPRTWSSWAVTRDGILFIEDLPNGRSILSFYQPAQGQIKDLVTLNTAPRWMGATFDGKKAVMNDTEERQISMIENLR